MDAIAVTIATGGKAIGLAPLGTSLTEEQAAQLNALGRTPVVARDADLAGRAAADRDYWILTLYGIDPLRVDLPDDKDPADLVTGGRSDRLAAAIETARPLADVLIDEILTATPHTEGALDCLRVVGAQPSPRWASGVEHIAQKSGIPTSLLQDVLLPLVGAWNVDPRGASRQAQHQFSQVTRHRVESATGPGVAIISTGNHLPTTTPPRGLNRRDDLRDAPSPPRHPRNRPPAR